MVISGSVDDGKSTVVGRLLNDVGAVPTDQLEAVARASRERGSQEVDLSLLTDGLRAEREQGITIDVAYRYFTSGRRRFVIADAPGHVQYTRNMVTGASTAQLAVILVDARRGVVEQTRRHAAVAALLRVPHVVLAVNKMDLVGYDEGVFAAIVREFSVLDGATAVPVSALRGDNVVRRSPRMPWYDGPTLLQRLEEVPVAGSDVESAVRLPVQYVIRPRVGEHRDYRGYAGVLVSGRLRVGDEVVVLPSKRRSTVVGIDVLGREVRSARAGQSVAVRLADDIDLSRGDVIASAAGAPEPVRELLATVCQLSDEPLREGARVLLKTGTRTVQAVVREITGRLDVSTLLRGPAGGALAGNDIGTVRIRTADPVVVDGYRDNRSTGAFILIDPVQGTTVTAGLVDAGEP